MPSKVVVVTGSNGDIGKPLIKELLNVGYSVAACVRDISKVDDDFQNADALKYFECDFSEENSINECILQIKRTYKSIFGLVNCIGIAHGSSFMMSKSEDFIKVFQINHFSVMSFSQQLVRKMIKNREGSIINVASTAGILADEGSLIYGGSKAALIHSSKVMANELGAFKIRVNAVAPAVVESKMAKLMDDSSLESIDNRSALKSKITPSEIVSMIIYLLSDSSINITGQVFCIDRGLTN